MTDSALWSVGVLGKVHGLKGELYLNLAVDGLQRLEAGERFFLPPGRAPESPVPARSRAWAARTSAPSLSPTLRPREKRPSPCRGSSFLASGAGLDQQPHYRVGDLVGLPVRTASGRLLGEVSDVLEAPAHEILAVRAPDGSELLLPLVDELVRLTDDELVVVDGLLDEPEPSGEG